MTHFMLGESCYVLLFKYMHSAGLDLVHLHSTVVFLYTSIIVQCTFALPFQYSLLRAIFKHMLF